MKRPAHLALFLLSPAVLALDRLTKAAIHNDLTLPAQVIPGFFRLVKTWNVGLAFGAFSGASASIMNPLITGVGLLASGWLLAQLLFGRQSFRLTVAFHLLLGGALGNIWDRLHWGAVLDFLEFHVGSFYWPSFNISDSAITIGLGVLVWDMIFVRESR
jgi:signal peptidase II